MTLALGKLPTKHDPRTLRLAAYFNRAADVPVPTAVDYGVLAGGFRLYGNDVHNNCTAASGAHLVQVQHALIHAPLVPSLEAVMRLYAAASGYDPRTGANDNGAYLLDVLNLERKQGLGRQRVHAFAAVDPHDRTEVRRAIFLFGGLRVGLNLPRTIEDRDAWDVYAAAQPGDDLPGSWGGHAVTLAGYDTSGPLVISWGKRYRASWAFFERYCDEAYACLPAKWQKDDPFEALDWPTLGRDLAQFGPINGGSQ